MFRNNRWDYIDTNTNTNLINMFCGILFLVWDGHAVDAEYFSTTQILDVLKSIGNDSTIYNDFSFKYIWTDEKNILNTFEVYFKSSI